jgi:signal transduction histidine kinase
MICGALVVVAIAVLQYRWNEEATEATGVRLADALQLSMVNWHLDLFRNLSEICLTLRMPPAARDARQEYRARLAEWRTIARYPELVAAAYLIRADSHEQLPMSAGSAAPPDDWSPALERVAARVRRLPALSTPVADRQLTESFYNIGSALRDWHFEPSLPALVRVTQPGAEWLLIRLDARILQERIFPDLAHRYFQGTNGLDYEVAVVAHEPRRRVVYASDPGFGEADVADADGRMDVFATSTSVIRIFHRTTDNQGPTAAAGVNWFPLLDQPGATDWQLVVRHRRGGPLGAFVAQMRQRGLAISFGALLLLVISMSLLLVTSMRARRLGRLQMDFVTAVSHELRTPLTIISSAADNLADGVVESGDQLKEYGAVIGSEVNQLSGLVERILLFAATREGRHHYALEPLDAASIIDAVLTGTSALIRTSQFTVERQIAAGLPQVIGDRLALSHCLENLITNALKYGKDSRWIRIEATPVSGGHQVEISVADGGIGIDALDLPHIFEPFYRGDAVRLAQIHGTGLGLAVASQMAQAMGGTLTANSAPGQGSTFTITLRAAEQRAG